MQNSLKDESALKRSFDNKWLDNKWLDNKWLDNKWLDNKWLKALMVFFAVYQAGHLVVIIQFFLDAIEFPAPPASGEWSEHAQHLFFGMGVADGIVALASVIAAVAFLRRRSWSLWLALVATSSVNPGAAIFAIGTLRSGTDAMEIFWVNALYLPGYALWIWLCWIFHRLCRQLA